MPRGVKVYGVAKMETAHIACRVEANPPQVAFRWTFNNSAEAKQGRPTDPPSILFTSEFAQLEIHSFYLMTVMFRISGWPKHAEMCLNLFNF